MQGTRPQRKRPMHRSVIRLCAFFLTLSILTVFAPGSAQAQMCVRYARQLTSFSIQGDAWMWWQNAVGHYQRGMRPVEGSVLVFRRTGRLHYGHVSVVSKVVDRRTILVDHSWLEGDVLHRGMKVVDTSPNNNWTSVKVWYEPSDNLGLRAYPTFGFIYPHGTKGFEKPLAVAANDDSDDDAPATVRPAARASVQPARVASLFLPHRKPAPGGVATAHAEATVAEAKVAEAKVAEATAGVGYLPRRKPGAAGTSAAAEARKGVEYAEVPQVVVPRHKPRAHGNAEQVADAELSD